MTPPVNLTSRDRELPLQNENASEKGVSTANTNFHDGDVKMPAYIQMHACMYACMYVCMHACMYVHTKSLIKHKFTYEHK